MQINTGQAISNEQNTMQRNKTTCAVQKINHDCPITRTTFCYCWGIQRTVEPLLYDFCQQHCYKKCLNPEQ